MVLPGEGLTVAMQKDAFDSIFSSIERTRRELVTELGGDAPVEIRAERYIGIDHLVRSLLLAASRYSWPVPDDEFKKARKGQLMGQVVSLAEQYAPPSVSRELLSTIKTKFHHLRNAAEHEGYQVSSAELSEYLEAVESLAYSIALPALLSLPPDPLHGLEGFSLIGSVELARGQGDCPWYVAHAMCPLDIGSRHSLLFWRYDGQRWQLARVHDLGQQYVVTAQKVNTRSSTEEELLVWRRAGESMGMMGYDVFAVGDQGILRLLGRPSEAGAYLIVRGRAIEEHAGQRVTRYEWDGDAYVGQLVVRHEPAPIDYIDVHYAVSPTGRVQGVETITCSVGQSFRLLRVDFEDVVVRLLASAGPGAILNWSSQSTFTAVAPGEGRISLIPHVYDWENALEIKVVVESDGSGRAPINPGFQL